jgi:protein gp37
MADRTTIEWVVALAEARGAVPSSWNPVLGCSRASVGCEHCYAAAIAHRFGSKGDGPFAGLTDLDPHGVPRFNGTIKVQDHLLTKPLSWRRPHVVFVGDMADLFHPNVPDEYLDRIFAVMGLATDHLFLLLTKRPERMREYITTEDRDEAIGWAAQSILDDLSGGNETTKPPRGCDPAVVSSLIHGPSADGSRFKHRDMWPLPNVWLGVAAEDQGRADERIPDLLATPSAKRFVSVEPMLGPVDLENIVHPSYRCPPNQSPEYWPPASYDALRGHMKGPDDVDLPKLDWVIVGGESGPHARPMHPDWARSLRDQCAAAGVPFFFKQWGEWTPGECIGSPQTKTETGAWWIDRKWSIERITARFGQEMHTDDEPDVWRVGKLRAGRLLDGVEHNEVPE